MKECLSFHNYQDQAARKITSTMGNAAIRKVPEDLTKCTELQLRCMINSVIINNPWNDDDDQSEEESLNETISIMRHKGFRPITPKEYVEELKRLRNEPSHTNQGVRVWIPIGTTPLKLSEDATFSQKKNKADNRTGTSSTPHTTASAKLSISCTESKDSCYSHSSANLERIQLPSSREDAANEILRSGASDAVLSELTSGEDNIETEEWPTNGINQKYQRQHLQF